jgi:hypothetical protein
MGGITLEDCGADMACEETFGVGGKQRLNTGNLEITLRVRLRRCRAITPSQAAEDLEAWLAAG